MMTQSANILTQSMFALKIKQTRLHNVKEYLLNALQISPQRQGLVMLLGQGSEKNNAEALYCWLECQSKIDPDFSTLSLGDIEGRLLRHLERGMDQWPG